MKACQEGEQVRAKLTRREVLKAGAVVAAAAVLVGKQTSDPENEARPRIRIKPLRRQDAKPDPNLAG